MGFTCPACESTSQSIDDEAEGYCGNCHDWTGRLPDGKILATGCPCGETHAVSAQIWREYVELAVRLPLDQKVCMDGVNYLIPRRFTALHGLKGADFPGLAERYGFRRIL